MVNHCVSIGLCIAVYSPLPLEKENKCMHFVSNKRPILDSRPVVERAAANLPKWSNVSIQVDPRE